MDDSFSIPGLAEEAAEPEAIAARAFIPYYLPDGTPLRLTAGILADLAAIFHDEFSAYIPQRADEFSTMIWMASRPRDERGAAWRDSIGGRVPLMADFPAFRATVSRWLDDTFRASEADYPRQAALRLWQYHNEARVTVSDQKKSQPVTATARPLIIRTASPSISTPLQGETS